MYENMFYRVLLITNVFPSLLLSLSEFKQLMYFDETWS
jgi:hypothetical protein